MPIKTSFEHVTSTDIEKVERYEAFLGKVLENVKENEVNLRVFLINLKKRTHNRAVCLRAALKQNKKATA